MKQKIKIGMCIDFNEIDQRFPVVARLGVQSVSLTGKVPLPERDWERVAARVRDFTRETGISVSTIGVYGNPLNSEQDRLELEKMIHLAKSFGTDMVSTFAGALPGKPVEAAFARFQEVFAPLATEALKRNVRIAIENCLKQGSWMCATQNIAFNPKAWEKMFELVPYENLGLEWEPAHQLAQLIDPIAQLKRWGNKVFHVHGKDGIINWDFIQHYGVSGTGYHAQFCNPGNGETDWKVIADILKEHNYNGSISIEGGHDPFYTGEKEIEGEYKTLCYLKKCVRY